MSSTSKKPLFPTNRNIIGKEITSNLCTSAQALLITYGIALFIFLFTNWNVMVGFDLRTLIGIIIYMFIAASSSISIDIYCKTGHGQWSWLLTFIMIFSITVMLIGTSTTYTTLPATNQKYKEKVDNTTRPADEDSDPTINPFKYAF